MTWQIESFTDVGGNKDQEFVKFIDLPSRTPQPFELADQRPAGAAARARLGDGRRDGRLAHALGLPRLHPALEGRVRRRQAHLRRDASGWFSDRTECYLAAGRPALVQDTGWTAHLPAGEGLLAFSTPDEALDGIDRINARLRAPRARAPRRSRASTSTPRACCRALLEAAVRMSTPLRIAHVAPVATTIPPPKSGSVETMTSLLTEGLVARGHDVTLFATGDSTTTRDAARDLPARLLARRAHVAVGAVRDAQPRGRGRARARLRHHPLRGGVLPDVARLHAALADADRADAASLAERGGGRALVALSGGAVRRDLRTSRRACSRGLNVVGTVLHGIDTDGFAFRETPDDYLLFLGRFTEGKGVLQAIEVAQARRHAAGARRRRGRLLPRARRAARRRHADRLRRRGRLTRPR